MVPSCNVCFSFPSYQETRFPFYFIFLAGNRLHSHCSIFLMTPGEMLSEHIYPTGQVKEFYCHPKNKSYLQLNHKNKTPSAAIHILIYTFPFLIHRKQTNKQNPFFLFLCFSRSSFLRNYCLLYFHVYLYIKNKGLFFWIFFFKKYYLSLSV